MPGRVPSTLDTLHEVAAGATISLMLVSSKGGFRPFPKRRVSPYASRSYSSDAILQAVIAEEVNSDEP